MGFYAKGYTPRAYQTLGVLSKCDYFFFQPAVMAKVMGS